jgi:cation:H+ antiporter
MLNFFWLALALLLLIKSSDYAIRYTGRLALALRLSRYTIGFTIVAAVSILPETFISISSALQGISPFGLGTLFGSNVADLTFVFAMVVLTAGHNLRVESQVLKNRLYYAGILALPILLGLNGYYSRWEGAILILAGLAFYFFIFKNPRHGRQADAVRPKLLATIKNSSLLFFSLVALLLGAYLTVKFAIASAIVIGVSPVLIALMVGLGTCLPELSFSLKAAKNNHENLALGDILGTVITDATIVVGILALIRPFAFAQRIVFITGLFMLFAVILLLYFMKTGKALTKSEGLLLLLFYFLFVFIEFTAGGNVNCFNW